MKLPKLRIGNLVVNIPIVQGGMGIGISLSSLAGNVSLNGGLGVISGVEIGFNEKDYFKNKKEANIRSIKKHIRKAKEICNNGVVGINLMVALNNFEEMVKESIKEKIDIIFSGAGLPLNLPKQTKGTDTKAAPIVSSGRAAALICKTWDRSYQVIPDAIVVEGPKAGGHLGYKKEDLNKPAFQLDKTLKKVLNSIKPFEEKYNRKIPVIAGGGVFNGKDIAKLLKAGASGVQLGSRFVTTHECDASEDFKKTYLECNAKDIKIIKSPVGMIGRAINSSFLDDVNSGIRKQIKCIANCLKPCKPKEAPYCIADALINAQKGNMQSGFAFAGAETHRISKITSVKELMNELVVEAESNLDSNYDMQLQSNHV